MVIWFLLNRNADSAKSWQTNWVMDIFDITKGVGISLSAGAFHMEAYFTSTKDFCQIDPAYINKW